MLGQLLQDTGQFVREMFLRGGIPLRQKLTSVSRSPLWILCHKPRPLSMRMLQNVLQSYSSNSLTWEMIRPTSP
jgi:hypothetical protein